MVFFVYLFLFLLGLTFTTELAMVGAGALSLLIYFGFSTALKQHEKERGDLDSIRWLVKNLAGITGILLLLTAPAWDGENWCAGQVISLGVNVMTGQTGAANYLDTEKCLEIGGWEYSGSWGGWRGLLLIFVGIPLLITWAWFLRGFRGALVEEVIEEGDARSEAPRVDERSIHPAPPRKAKFLRKPGRETVGEYDSPDQYEFLWKNLNDIRQKEQITQADYRLWVRRFLDFQDFPQKVLLGNPRTEQVAETLEWFRFQAQFFDFENEEFTSEEILKGIAKALADLAESKPSVADAKQPKAFGEKDSTNDKRLSADHCGVCKKRFLARYLADGICSECASKP